MHSLNSHHKPGAACPSVAEEERKKGAKKETYRHDSTERLRSKRESYRCRIAAFLFLALFQDTESMAIDRRSPRPFEYSPHPDQALVF